MKIGAHISTNGGVLSVFPKAEALGINCFQIFASSPRMWRVPPVDEKTAALFKYNLNQGNFSPSFVHIKYLVNIGSFDNEIYLKSIQAIKDELTVASDLGLAGGMFHIGAPKDGNRNDSIKRVIDACKEILHALPQNVLLILENSASHKKLGGSLEEVADLIQKINHPQVSVCLDTAHALAAGYDLRSEAGINQFVADIEKTIGLTKVSLFHLNDSKSDYCSGRDLHENIGEGKIGVQSIKCLLTHPKLADKPFILEVPGFENQGPDKKNVDILKALLA